MPCLSRIVDGAAHWSASNGHGLARLTRATEVAMEGSCLLSLLLFFFFFLPPLRVSLQLP